MARLASVWKRHPIVVATALAFMLRLGWVARLPQVLAWDDEREFVATARGVVDGRGYVSRSYRANPVLPLYLAASFAVFGDGYTPPRIGQAAFGAATCALTGWSAATLFGSGVGALTALLLAVYPPHVYLAGVFYVDAMLSFLVAASVALIVAVARRPREAAALAFAAGVTMGLTALTRALFLVVLPVATIAWIVHPALAPRRGLVLAFVALAGAAVVILPWTARNFSVYDRFLLISSGSAAKLWEGNNEIASGGAEDRDLRWTRRTAREWKRRAKLLPRGRQRAFKAEYRDVEDRVRLRERQLGDRDLALDEVLGPLGLRDIKADPLRTARLFMRKIHTLYSPFTPTASSNAFSSPLYKLVALASFYPMMVLALVGAAATTRRLRETAVLYGVIAAVTAAYAAYTACTRFRLPLDPFLLVFAAVAMVEPWRRQLADRRA